MIRQEGDHCPPLMRHVDPRGHVFAQWIWRGSDGICLYQLKKTGDTSNRTILEILDANPIKMVKAASMKPETSTVYPDLL